MNADQEASAIGALIAQRISRRAVLGGVVTATALAGTGMSWRSAYALGPSSLAFEELARGLDTDFHVAPAHDAQVLIRWGDPVY
ncbi:MAG: dTDP-glucose 4,6-dehydratase, partial [Alphaproteobacteria bacterium]